MKHTYSLLEKILFLSTGVNKERLRNELRGKTIIITGASSGIGEEIAYFLADFPVHLILVARREAKLLFLKEEIEKKQPKSASIVLTFVTRRKWKPFSPLFISSLRGWM
ncbi:FlaA1/EpsC-like NDP-sugar epimerase [Robertmurraya andreesenii]|uniref:FlaA1/EpsC-like NDP-sugar epimerase n=1 Tax=Anoxybacillus andreesenii TaxID=1325932 RepID=A0ABT9V5U9_9BACL|nr:SDR family NAD(P)-dependent oxidoreductase [Robertmurraya andreesenii]MDQ0156325.1 FlaA1/EpsC-like NDP-sugar epimerase [Robertmurraya andreesenii]